MDVEKYSVQHNQYIISLSQDPDPDNIIFFHLPQREYTEVFFKIYNVCTEAESYLQIKYGPRFINHCQLQNDVDYRLDCPFCGSKDNVEHGISLFDQNWEQMHSHCYHNVCFALSFFYEKFSKILVSLTVSNTESKEI